MTRKRTMIVASVCGVAVVIGLAAYFVRQRTSSPPEQQMQVDRKDVAPSQHTTDHPPLPPTENNTTVDRPVAPMLELQDIIAAYEQELIEQGERTVGMATTIAQWKAAKQAGRTRWGSEKWMKPPEYYAALDTTVLAEECFAGSVFGNEMAIYNEPAAGLESLRIFHNGFAELLQREDMWKGVLHIYDRLSEQVDPHADFVQIVTASSQLDELRKLYRLSPLKDQVKGKEQMFLPAQVKVLQRYKRYLETYDPQKTGGSPGFFREPCSVAEVAMLLAKQVDPQTYAKIEPAITSVRWTEKQHVEDLRSFIVLVLDSLEPIAAKGGTMAQ